MELADLLIGEMWSDRLSGNLDSQKYNELLQTISGMKNYTLVVSHIKEKTVENQIYFEGVKRRLNSFTSNMDAIIKEIETLYSEALALYQKHGNDRPIITEIAKWYCQELHNIGNTALKEFNSILEMSREHVNYKTRYTQ